MISGALRALGPVAAVSLLGGCAHSVDVTLPAGASNPVCRSAAPQWPRTVGGMAVVATSPQDPAVAAWGSPAVIARCGVTPEVPTTERCVTVDDIDWIARDLTDGTSFTTYGRDPAIEVLIPSRYRPEALLLPAFNAAASALPRNGHACS